MSGRLIERSSEHAGTVHALEHPITAIGRAKDNDIVVDSVYASSHHAQVWWDGEHYVLHDLGSKNGTVLNGQRVTEPQLLRSGDVISLPGLMLVFYADEETLTLAREESARGELRVDTKTAEVWVRNRQVSVTAKEYLALALLYEKGGALVSKEELARHVWPEYQGAVGDENIEQLISRLRRKLEENPEQPRYLLTVRGLGYRLIVSRSSHQV